MKLSYRLNPDFRNLGKTYNSELLSCEDRIKYDQNTGIMAIFAGTGVKLYKILLSYLTRFHNGINDRVTVF